jgi:hypothetical protein
VVAGTEYIRERVAGVGADFKDGPAVESSGRLLGRCVGESGAGETLRIAVVEARGGCDGCGSGVPLEGEALPYVLETGALCGGFALLCLLCSAAAVIRRRCSRKDNRIGSTIGYWTKKGRLVRQ